MVFFRLRSRFSQQRSKFIASKPTFDALDEARQKAILAAASAAEKRGRSMSQKETATKTDTLKTNGMIVVEPSVPLLEGLKAIGEQMQTDGAASASKEAKAIVVDYGTKWLRVGPLWASPFL